MTEVTIDLVEKNTDAILEIVGKDSFVDWEQFTMNSSDVARHIDQLNSALTLFREIQHKNFIQTMKKLKNYDLPDILQAVKAKKLPKEALRGVLTRFKLNGDKLELNDPVDSLKESAKNQYATYSQKNNQIVQELKNFIKILNKNIESSGMVPEKMPQMERIKSTVKFTISDDAATKLASAIDIQYLAGTKKLISIKTYSQLIDSTFTLIKDQYKSLTEQSRKNQRQNMANHPQYFKYIHEYLNNCEALIAEGQSLLASKLGITEQQLGESEIALMERGMGENVLGIQTQLRGKIKESMRSEKDVPVEVARQVIKYQVQTIESKYSEINSVLKNLQKGPETIQMVPMLLAIILNDYVFEKYGYEEEDFMKNLGEKILSDAQFIQIFKDMEAAIMKLMQKLEVIPPEVAEMMKQQQAMMEQMGGMGGMGMPGMGMPGMGAPGMGMPGPNMMGNQSSNPFDMLQNQQMQQMQQMFQNMQPPK